MDTALTVDRCPSPPGTVVLALHGDADRDTAPVLARALRRALAVRPAPEALVVDCSGLRLCTSSCLNHLLRARSTAAEAGTVFCLAAPSPALARLLAVTETDTVFDILPARPARPGPAAGGTTAAPAGPAHARARLLAAQAERRTADGAPVPEAAALFRAIAARLADAVGPAAEQEQLPGIERLERLREALAALALGLARTHGRPAWILARAADVLSPALHWRALTDDGTTTFGTVVPTPDDLTDAERAVRALHDVLTREAAQHTAAAGIRPRSG
ncbi:STAS domain-containing protein [Kitasatospora cineracea]|uniref:Anti-anti-sigma factor n=1 Tax=Kitasatospora cineracea TaxID=88074 RepID=A0A3N4R563_9ACTN|nr:STAS domain-containing protein [Kitasatospora cineracea]RPE28528.1 anti-anti-sigma factor [Kitasatospora cineracea]